MCLEESGQRPNNAKQEKSEAREAWINEQKISGKTMCSIFQIMLSTVFGDCRPKYLAESRWRSPQNQMYRNNWEIF